MMMMNIRWWIWILFRCGGHGIGSFTGIVGAHGMFVCIYIFYILIQTIIIYRNETDKNGDDTMEIALSNSAI